MLRLKRVVGGSEILEFVELEKMGFWRLYWLLIVSMVIQSIWRYAPLPYYAGEYVLFVFASIYIAFSCSRKPN